MLTSPASVLTPSSLSEALTMRVDFPDAMPIAGGTDLMVGLELGAVNPPQFLDLWGLKELNSIRTHDDGSVSIGALVTYNQLTQSSAVNGSAPSLVEAAYTVGAKQIQNRGTLAGNIANASPAGDTLPVLLTLDAEVEVESTARGTRRIPFRNMYTGYRQLELAADELITWVHLPPRHANDRTHFRKVGTRLAQSISKVILAVRLRVDGEMVVEARVALGSVAPIPMRAPSVESALVGGVIDPKAADRVSRDITPIDDIRSTQAYRMAVATRTLRSCLESMVG